MFRHLNRRHDRYIEEAVEGRITIHQIQSIDHTNQTRHQLPNITFIMSQQKLKPTFDDVMGCQTAVYEWADSYDSKVRCDPKTVLHSADDR
jgi:hypothetical protein